MRPTQTTESGLWQLARSGQGIDVTDLAGAIAREAVLPELDFRTRLLIRDSLNALCSRWGFSRTDDWLNATGIPARLKEIWDEPLGPAGFASLGSRLMDSTNIKVVEQFLRELGLRCPQSEHIDIGGAIALILPGMISRQTDDIDVVDEIPASIRGEHKLADELAARYGLRLAHFQSHFLPDGWKQRVHSLGRFGKLEVCLVDAIDVFVGKLFSVRVKDRDDLRALAPQLNRHEIEARLKQFGGRLRSEINLAKAAADNWYILYGQPLPG